MECQWWLWCILIAILSTPGAHSDCWTEPECRPTGDCDIDYLNCTSKSFGKLHFRHLKRDNTCNYNTLRNITLISCNIHDLEKTVFQQFTNLTYLNLSLNYLESLNSNIFLNLTRLEELDLSYNQLISLQDERLFKEQRNLKKLKLCYNQLITLSPKLFSNMKHVSTIDLSHNNLTILPENLFEAQTKLKRIMLSFNQLKHLSSQLFLNANNMKLIDLSNNHLNAFNETIFTSQSNMKTLNLCCNKLTHLHPKLFSSLINVEAINLSENNLTSLSNDLFYSQHELKTLLLRNNKLQKMNLEILSPLKSINKLDLSHNNFLCECELVNILQWLRDHQLVTGLTGYTCQNISYGPKIPWSQISDKNNCTKEEGAITVSRHGGVSISAQEQENSTSKTQVILMAVFIFMAFQLMCFSAILILYLRRRRNSSGNNGHEGVINLESRSRNTPHYDYATHASQNEYHIVAPELPNRPSHNIPCDEPNRNDDNSSEIYEHKYYEILDKPNILIAPKDSTESETYEKTNDTIEETVSELNNLDTPSNFSNKKVLFEGIITSSDRKLDMSETPIKKTDDNLSEQYAVVRKKLSNENEVDSGLTVKNSLYYET